MGPIKWATKARVLGLTVDHKLTWDANVMDVVATKLDLLKRSRFSPKSVLRDFYFKVARNNFQHILSQDSKI